METLGDWMICIGAIVSITLSLALLVVVILIIIDNVSQRSKDY